MNWLSVVAARLQRPMTQVVPSHHDPLIELPVIERKQGKMGAIAQTARAGIGGVIRIENAGISGAHFVPLQQLCAIKRAAACHVEEIKLAHIGRKNRGLKKARLAYPHRPRRVIRNGKPLPDDRASWVCNEMLDN